jgi:hypothetical protein
MEYRDSDFESFESAWEIARRLYYGDGQHSGNEPTEMEFVSVEDVHKVLQQADSCITSRNRKGGFSTAFHNFVTRLDAYGRAIDTFAQSSTMIFAPIWGSIRILIQVTKSPRKFGECTSLT